MKLLSVWVIVGLLWVGTQPQDRLRSVPISTNKDEGAAIAKTTDRHERWSNRWTMERSTLDEKPVLFFTEQGSGLHSPFKEQVRWTIETWWTNNGTLKPLRSRSRYSDSQGKELLREAYEFDWMRGQVRFEKMDLKSGKTKTETLSVPPDTLTVDGIAGVLRALDFAKTQVFSAHLLTHEPKVYEITLEVRGKQMVQTTKGTVQAYKVELVPHLGLLNVLRFLYPKTYFWFSVDPSHEWIRYEGLENGPGTPEILMEVPRSGN